MSGRAARLSTTPWSAGSRRNVGSTSCPSRAWTRRSSSRSADAQNAVQRQLTVIVYGCSVGGAMARQSGVNVPLWENYAALWLRTAEPPRGSCGAGGQRNWRKSCADICRTGSQSWIPFLVSRTAPPWQSRRRPPGRPATSQDDSASRCGGSEEGCRMGLRDLVYLLYERRLEASLSPSAAPRHVGAMADGNPRWAPSAGMVHASRPPRRG